MIDKLWPCKECGIEPRLCTDYDMVVPYWYCCSHPQCYLRTILHRDVLNAATEWNLHHGVKPDDEKN